MDVTIGIATYGPGKWRKLAAMRAVPAAKELGVPVIHVHGSGTLAMARNEVLDQVETEFIVYCDGDDQLEPGYVEAMAAGSADLRGPAVRHVWPTWSSEPEVPKVWAHNHDCVAECLRAGNWLCIGTAARVDLLKEVGGWWEEGWSEDWSLFARAWVAGATVEAVPLAVYRAHHARRSRNKVRREVALDWHRQIEQAVFGEVTV
jgi:glycosyltransferase involved in cell wall biosynthesis